MPRETTSWPLDPHTQGKHLVLQYYMEAWLPIMTTWNGRVLFIDAFAGPGEYSGCEPGSPLVALRAFTEHSARKRMKGNINYLFIEKDPNRCGQSRYIQAYGSSTATAGDCTYRTRTDDPHASGGDISVHGWWEIVQPSTCPSRADVTTVLQGVWCDFWLGACWWEQAGRDKDRIRPGGGRGKRVTARVACHSSEATGFRSVVDVDLPGIVDPSNKAYSEPRDFNCRPANWSS